MAITTMDGLVAAIAASQLLDTYEASMTAKAAGDFQSLWTASGRPGPGATPPSGAGGVPTNATAGSIPYTNPGSGTGYLAKLYAASSTVESIILYDRLVATSGLSGTVTTAQTVNSTAITRSYNSGVDVGCWLEVYTQLGGTAVTATVSYTNQSGTSGRSGSASIVATAVVGMMFPVTLASGDTGVQSVQSVTLSATTGTAGNFGITLSQRLAIVPITAANIGYIFDYAALGLPVIVNSACLAWIVLCSAANTGAIITELCFVSG